MEIESVIASASFCYLLVWGFLTARKLSDTEIARQIRIQRVSAIVTLVSVAITMALDGSKPPRWLEVSLAFSIALGIFVTSLQTLVGAFLALRFDRRKAGSVLLGVGILTWLILFAWGRSVDAFNAFTS